MALPVIGASLRRALAAGAAPATTTVATLWCRMSRFLPWCALVLLAACGGSGGDSPAEASLRLLPGGTIVGVDGVAVGATAGALNESHEMLIERVDMPAQPLPTGSTAVAGFHRIQAPQPVALPAERPLLLGLPIPQELAP